VKAYTAVQIQVCSSLTGPRAQGISLTSGRWSPDRPELPRSCPLAACFLPAWKQCRDTRAML